ncbi:putative phosphorylase [Coniochaeta ligniaria NRRL 30616]|uniref:Putative phosphorylase n=1 Tax=Coniochaeta ligniaria NRRL 30616 TaxID=1408157 RepID=A0A1J7I3S3_9PEZI|nr:putative phosphorylase [Coniochaeta ligniaria NRRL 30616]
MGSVSNITKDAEETAIVSFDKLVSQGIINYGPSFPTYSKVDGFQFEFRLRPSWATKPRIPTDSVSSVPAKQEEHFGPGSDILKSHPDQVLDHLSCTHILALNIYPSSRPHYLILTLDSFRRQDEPLDAQDIKAAWAFLHSLRNHRDNYVVYNCAPASGCSRKHKHLQVARRPGTGTEAGETDVRFFPDVDGEAAVKVPYRYLLHRFAGPGIEHNTAEDVHEIYLRFLAECKGLLGSADCPPHNMILTSEWLLMIPRRYPEKGAYLDLLPNGAGMMGMISSPSQAVLDKWAREGPAKVLGAFGLPPES